MSESLVNVLMMELKSTGMRGESIGLSLIVLDV